MMANGRGWDQSLGYLCTSAYTHTHMHTHPYWEVITAALAKSVLGKRWGSDWKHYILWLREHVTPSCLHPGDTFFFLSGLYSLPYWLQIAYWTNLELTLIILLHAKTVNVLNFGSIPELQNLKHWIPSKWRSARCWEHASLLSHIAGKIGTGSRENDHPWAMQLFFGAGLGPYGGTAVSWWLGIGPFLFSFILPFSALLFFSPFSPFLSPTFFSHTFFSFSLFLLFFPPPHFFSFSSYLFSFFSFPFSIFLPFSPYLPFSPFLYSSLFLLFPLFSFSFSIFSFSFSFLPFFPLLSATMWKAHHCLHHFTHLLFCSVCPTQQTSCRQRSDPALAVALSCCFSLLPPCRNWATSLLLCFAACLALLHPAKAKQMTGFEKLKKSLPLGKSVHCRGLWEKCVTNTFHLIVIFFSFLQLHLDSIFCLLKPSKLYRAFSLCFLFLHQPITFLTSAFCSEHNSQLNFHCKSPDLRAPNNTDSTWKWEIKPERRQTAPSWASGGHAAAAAFPFLQC